MTDPAEPQAAEESAQRFRQFLWDQMRSDSGVAAQVRAMHGQTLCACNAPTCHAGILQKAAAWLAGRDPTMDSKE